MVILSNLSINSSNSSLSSGVSFSSLENSIFSITVFVVATDTISLPKTSLTTAFTVESLKLSLLKEMISSLLANSRKIIFTTPDKCNFNKGYQKIFNNFRFAQNINWIKSKPTYKNKETLWKDIRKSYRSPINKGLKKQNFLIIDKFNLDIDKFKLIQKLHF